MDGWKSDRNRKKLKSRILHVQIPSHQLPRYHTLQFHQYTLGPESVYSEYTVHFTHTTRPILANRSQFGTLLSVARGEVSL